MLKVISVYNIGVRCIPNTFLNFEIKSNSKNANINSTIIGVFIVKFLTIVAQYLFLLNSNPPLQTTVQTSLESYLQ